jgi:hypothetical protein
VAASCDPLRRYPLPRPTRRWLHSWPLIHERGLRAIHIVVVAGALPFTPIGRGLARRRRWNPASPRIEAGQQQVAGLGFDLAPATTWPWASPLGKEAAWSDVGRMESATWQKHRHRQLPVTPPATSDATSFHHALTARPAGQEPLKCGWPLLPGTRPCFGPPVGTIIRHSPLSESGGLSHVRPITTQLYTQGTLFAVADRRQN